MCSNVSVIAHDLPVSHTSFLFVPATCAQANDTLADDVRRKQYYLRLVNEEQNGSRPNGPMASDLRGEA